MHDQPTLREWLAARPFALSLSAGFFGFFAHAGFLAALEQAGLRPSRISGSSAGALVGGLWASGRDTEHLVDRLFALQRKDFWDPGLGAGLLRGRLFRGLLHELLDAPTFEGCRAPLTVSVFDVRRRRTRVLDRGPLAPAIQASCTFPGLFHPVWIDGRPHIDGGVADRAGLRGMPDGERVLYHHLSTSSRLRRYLRHSGVPARSDMVSLVTEGLPRVGPFRLPRGRDAYLTAREALTRGLDRPIDTAASAPQFIG